MRLMIKMMVMMRELVSVMVLFGVMMFGEVGEGDFDEVGEEEGEIDDAGKVGEVGEGEQGGSTHVRFSLVVVEVPRLGWIPDEDFVS